jgi:hypothetical protein
MKASKVVSDVHLSLPCSPSLFLDIAPLSQLDFFIHSFVTSSEGSAPLHLHCNPTG